MTPYWQALFDALEVTTKEEADLTLEKLIKRAQQEDPRLSYGRARAIQLSNIGWFFGEVSRKTRKRAMELYPEAQHPIFGRHLDVETEPALSAGLVVARAIQKGKDIEAACKQARKVVDDAS